MSTHTDKAAGGSNTPSQYYSPQSSVDKVSRFQGLFNYTPVHWYNRAKQNITYKCAKYLKYHSCTYDEIIFDITWQNNDYSNTP